MITTKESILAYLKELKYRYAKDGIVSLALFGSYATNKAGASSDIDVLVEFDKDFLKTHDVWEYFDLLDDCKTLISKHFGVKVDLFDKDSDTPLKEHIFKELIYV